MTIYKGDYTRAKTFNPLRRISKIGLKLHHKGVKHAVQVRRSNILRWITEDAVHVSDMMNMKCHRIVKIQKILVTRYWPKQD